MTKGEQQTSRKIVPKKSEFSLIKIFIVLVLADLTTIVLLLIWLRFML